MNKMGQRRFSAQKWFVRYTAMMLLLFLFAGICLLLSGRTFLWGGDAYHQHYSTLAYARSALLNLFSGKGFPMLDTALGQGLDAIGVLSWHGLLNPLSWLCVFFNENGVELFYHIFIALNIYLSGLLFCQYIRTLRLDIAKNQVLLPLCGLMFATTGYICAASIKHLNFSSCSIGLLLMLISAERILQNRGKWRMMVFVTALMLMMNFYFAYQTTLAVIVYILIRLFARLRPMGIRRCAKDGFTLLGCYALGAALIMVVFLPILIFYFGNGRVGVLSGYTESLLHYPASYYAGLAAMFAAPYDYPGYWSLQGFSPMALFALLLLFRRGNRLELHGRVRQKAQLRLGFLLCILFLAVPFFGKLLNGMGYVTNRWSYIYALLVCLIAAWALPQLLQSDFALRRKYAAAAFAWSVCMALYAARTRKLTVALGALAVFLASGCLWLLDKPLTLRPKFAEKGIAFLTALCCFAYSCGYAINAMTDGTFAKKGIAARIDNELAAASSDIEDEGFYRVDTGIWEDSHAFIHGYNGLSYYWSLIPDTITRHYIDLEMGGMVWSYRVEGLAADAYLDTLASVKYALRSGDENRVLSPYGFESLRTVAPKGGDAVEVEVNEHALPLGYAFDSYLPLSEYEALNPLEKREALISAAVTEGERTDLTRADAGAYPVQEVEFALIEEDGVVREEQSLRFKKGGTMRVSFEAEEDMLYYLMVSGTKCRLVEDISEVRLNMQTADGINQMSFINENSNFNYAQKGACAYIGTYAGGSVEVPMRFNAAGQLEFEDFQIYGLPKSYYTAAVARLSGIGTWNPERTNDRFYGTVDMASDGILQIALPYSAGYSAYVDGQPAEPERCGVMYMGVSLREGRHTLELRYVTPGLIPGAAISACAALICVVLSVVQCRKRKKAAAPRG